jgi:hypothetical protein
VHAETSVVRSESEFYESDIDRLVELLCWVTLENTLDTSIQRLASCSRTSTEIHRIFLQFLS